MRVTGSLSHGSQPLVNTTPAFSGLLWNISYSDTGAI